MRRKTFRPKPLRVPTACAAAFLMLAASLVAADDPARGPEVASQRAAGSIPRVSSQADRLTDPAGGPRGEGMELVLPDLNMVRHQAGILLRKGADWYRLTPPGERMCWGGMLASAVLALVVLVERLARLRRTRVIPPEFTSRFLDRLHDGKLDGGKALDYCEMNPSPAARIALAAVRRWGRPAADMERAVTMAHRFEAERLRRTVGTLRRVAALAPLLGLLGSLLTAQRALAAMFGSGSVPQSAGPGAAMASAPDLASALVPLTMGVALAIVALVAYDLLMLRIERLAGSLDRLGAETIDAIAMATPPATRPLQVGMAGSHVMEPHFGHGPGTRHPTPAPHQVRTTGRRAVEGGRHGAASDPDPGY